MKKIPSLFEREGQGRKFLAVDRVTAGCEWVARGEGVPTRKWDGTACLMLDGKLYKRLEWEAKKGPAPERWLHHDFDPAQRSGHGWFPVGDGPDDWMHRLARTDGLPNGTYELCGPKVGKNPEGFDDYRLVRHGEALIACSARDFNGLREFLQDFPHEGIVWHHADGRMVKIKRTDFWR